MEIINNLLELSNKGYNNIEYIEIPNIIVALDASGDIHFFDQDKEEIKDTKNISFIKRNNAYELKIQNYTYIYKILQNDNQ